MLDRSISTDASVPSTRAPAPKAALGERRSTLLGAAISGGRAHAIFFARVLVVLLGATLIFRAWTACSGSTSIPPQTQQILITDLEKAACTIIGDVTGQPELVDMACSVIESQTGQTRTFKVRAKRPSPTAPSATPSVSSHANR
jgi:hypothetical protein